MNNTHTGQGNTQLVIHIEEIRLSKNIDTPPVDLIKGPIDSTEEMDFTRELKRSHAQLGNTTPGSTSKT